MRLLPFITACLILAACNLDTSLKSKIHHRQKQVIDSINNVLIKTKLGDPSDPLKSSYLALQKSEEIDYEEGMYGAMLDLGILHALSYQYDSAIFYLLQTRSYYQKLGQLNEGMTYYYLGKTYSDMQEYDQASGFYLEAIQLFDQLNEQEYLMNSKVGLGVLYGRQSEYTKALEYFEEAYEFKLQNNLEYHPIINNIAIVYKHMGQYEKALQFAKKAAELSDSYSLTIKLNTIGDIMDKMDQPDSAVYYYQKSHEKALESKRYFQAHAALNEIARIQLDNKCTYEALMTYQKNLQYFSDHPTNDLQTATLELITHDQLDLGYMDSALHYASRAFQSAKRNDIPESIMRNALLLKYIYQKEGNLGEAINYAETALAYKDTLTGKNMESTFADLRVKLETKDLEKSIFLLEKLAEIDELNQQILLTISIAFFLVLGAFILLILIRFKSRQKIQHLENERLKHEIEKNTSELYQQSLYMVQMNNRFSEIEKDLQALDICEKKMELRKILKKISISKVLDKEWENFNTYFGNVHKDFYQRLSKNCTRLTQYEKRICALLKINLSNREISSILNIEVKSVSMSRYRIKKKIGLAEEKDLQDFLLEI